MNIRKTIDILGDVKTLVRSKGYIYALCLIILDDFHFVVEDMHEIDERARLNKNELLLLFGFLIQDEVVIESPNSPFDLIRLKKKTYELMKELQASTLIPFVDKFKYFFENTEPRKSSKQDFFSGGNMFNEAIFYAGDGIYDFQYLEFLDRKYKYDEQWLNTNANFYFSEVKAIVSRIKSIHQEKIAKIDFFGLKEKRGKLLESFKQDESILKQTLAEDIDEFFSAMEFYQYYTLFETESHEARGLNREEISKAGWNSFYDGLIELFVIRKSDFTPELNISKFLEKFATTGEVAGRNTQFQSIGDFNALTAQPIIPLDSNRFFVPASFPVFEAICESPYYWMLQDEQYRNQLARNRGSASEEIAHEILVRVFGKERTFKSLKIESKKGHDDTDIDVLCILGTKALCVQLKSKKLTQSSRKGDFQQLKRDFASAVQDAYEQGLVCKDKILEKRSIFIDANGNKLKVTEEVDEVYILVVTTENYPSLAHQSTTLLQKRAKDPNPLVLTVFDLELLTFYLDNPYDLVYYVRQRIELMDYFFANEEMHFLGYHLLNKLWKDSTYDHVQLDNEFGKLIDRNYYPLKIGVETPATSDKIKNRWKNSSFDCLCKELDELSSLKKTDIIFHLLDWSQESRDNLMNQIALTKSRTNVDGKEHDLSIVDKPIKSTFGITYISWKDNDTQKLVNRLYRHSRGRKYKSKADLWIGIGCLRDSGRLVDAVFFSDQKWQHDVFLEEEVKNIFKNSNQVQQDS